MNKQRLLVLAAHLRKPDTQKHFDLGNWFISEGDDAESVGKIITHCGTTACIAGHAVALFAPETSANSVDEDIRKWAKEALGLTEEETRNLFVPDSDACDYDKTKAHHAANVVEHFAHTGVIDWTVSGIPKS